MNSAYATRYADIRYTQGGLDNVELARTYFIHAAKLAAATGGRLYKPRSFDALESTYAEVAEELRHQYTLYYSPLDKARDGRFRRVKVLAADPALSVSTRMGYFAPAR